MKRRIVTSKLIPKILGRMYLKATCENLTQKLILNHGSIIPFRVLPTRELERQEIFLLLRGKNYIPNHELKLFVEK